MFPGSIYSAIINGFNIVLIYYSQTSLFFYNLITELFVKAGNVSYYFLIILNINCLDVFQLIYQIISLSERVLPKFGHT